MKDAAMMMPPHTSTAFAILIVLACACSSLAKENSSDPSVTTIPVSPGCRNAVIPTGGWYAVRETKKSEHIGSLRRFYNRTLKKEGNVFGTDYCTFERRLVYANPIGTHGNPVRDDMTNLPAKVYLPVESKYATKWLCFRPDPTKDPECEGKPISEVAQVLPNGAELLETKVERTEGVAFRGNESGAVSTEKQVVPPAESVTPQQEAVTHEQLAVSLGDMADVIRETAENNSVAILKEIERLLQQGQKEETEKIGELSNEIAALTWRLDEGLTQIRKEVEKSRNENANLATEIQTRRADLERIGIMARTSSDDWKYFLIGMTVATGLIITGMGLARTRRQERKVTEERKPEKAEALVSPLSLIKPDYEPNMIQIEIPEGEPGAGMLVEREIYMKFKGVKTRFDDYVMPEHQEASFADMDPDQVRECVRKNTFRYLVMAKNLPDHWKHCEECKRIHEKNARAMRGNRVLAEMHAA
jgi:hypothetical protein